MLGRSAELAELRRLLAAADEESSAALVVDGPPGSGRTTLLDAIAEEASADATVVRIAGVESEAGLAWAGLHGLVWPLRRHLDQLAPHQRAVLEGALALGPPVDADRFAIGVATLHLLAAAAEDTTLLVTIDDAHWLDRSTLAVMTFVARRLDGERVVLLLSTDDAAADLDGIERLTLGPLDDADCALVLASHATTGVVPEVAETLARATAGNPGLLRELAHLLTPEALAGTAPLPEPLPAGPAVEASYRDRIESLPPAARAALRVAAMVHPGEVAEALGAVGATQADLDLAVRADLEPRHPLVLAAVHATSTPAERRAAHRAVASIVDGEVEPERRARHLARATDAPDDRVSTVVARAAASAWRRSAPAEASTLYEEAARLAVAPASAAELRVLAGEAALVAGAPARATVLVEGARITDALLAARASLVSCRAAMESGRSADLVGTLHRRAAAVAEHAPDVALTMLIDAVVLAVEAFRPEAAVDASDEASLVAGRLDAGAVTMAAVARGAALVASGEVDAGIVLLEGWEALFERDDLDTVDRLLRSAALALVWAERFEDASALLDRLAAEVRARCMAGALPRVLLASGILAFSTGDWQRMESDLHESALLAAATGHTATERVALANLGLLQSFLGRSTADANLDRAIALGGDRTPRAVATLVTVGRASLDLLDGRAGDAVATLRRLEREGTTTIPAATLWEADLAEALILSGDREGAALTLARFEEGAARTGHKRSLARVAGLRAVLADDVETGRRLVGDALALLEDPPIPFVRARVLVRWGERLVELGAREEATEVLHDALAVFEQLGAEPWQDLCRRALGEVVPPAAPTLDPEERRIVGEVARGAAIDQVASTMFRSPVAVERHLVSAMDKLGIGSRDELTAEPVVLPTVLRLLGTFEVRRGDADLTPPVGLAAKVLKVVALADGMLHVDEVAEVLWSGAETGRGRTRLRNVLTRLRASSGDVIERRGELLAVAAGVTVDVAQFRTEAGRALARRDVDVARRALSWYGGDLLPDSVYEPWATVPRERLRRDRLALLDLVADAASAAGDIDEAVRHLELAIEVDRFDEHRYVRLGRLLLAADRRSAVAAVVRRARHALAELDLQPSPDLLAVETGIRSPDLTG